MIYKAALSVLFIIFPRTDASLCRQVPSFSFCPKSNNRCYSQAEVKDGSSRQLESGRVVHYAFESDTSGKVTRTEVVAAVEYALNGGDSFEAEYEVIVGKKKKIMLRDLKRNDMLISEKDDLSEAFTLKNAFVTDDPDIVYRIDCPAVKLQALKRNTHTHKKHKHAQNTDYCQVTQQDTEGNVLINCMHEESLLVKDVIPDTCLDKAYNVHLMALGSNKEVPHFILFAERQDVNAGYNQDGCPPNIGMDSHKQKKQKSVYFKNDLKNVPELMLGSAPLGSILRAEENAVPLSGEKFDMATETCLHYTSRIWRSLDFFETDELAQFIITNIANKDGLLEELKREDKNFGEGGVHALEVFETGGKEAFASHLSDLVYSQLDINV